jgi:hypothetical protein
MQKLTIAILMAIVLYSPFYLFFSAIQTEMAREYEAPPREAAPNAYRESRKVKWKRTACSRCHVDGNAEFVERVKV